VDLWDKIWLGYEMTVGAGKLLGAAWKRIPGKKREAALELERIEDVEATRKQYLLISILLLPILFPLTIIMLLRLNESAKRKAELRRIIDGED
jgi:hypothetical protein